MKTSNMAISRNEHENGSLQLESWQEAQDLTRATSCPWDKIPALSSPGWATIAYRTIERWIRYAGREEVGIVSTGGISPYFLTVQVRRPAIEEFRQWIISRHDEEIDEEDLVGETEAPQLQKYDEFVPPQLLRKAFTADCLDIEEMKSEVSKWSKC